MEAPLDNLKGVINFGPTPNRYAQKNFVYSFFSQNVFSNRTVSFDFSLKKSGQRSFVTFNGANTSNTLYGDNGIVYMSNRNNNDKWSLYIDHLKYGTDEIKKRRAYNGEATIASASEFITVPMTEYMSLITHLLTVSGVKRDNNVLLAKGFQCDQLQLQSLSFQIGDIELILPPVYWTKDQFYKGQKTCLLMLRENNDARKNGYILGQPFLAAYSTVLDMEQNRIGLGTKISAMASGARIEGIDAPSDNSDQDKKDESDSNKTPDSGEKEKETEFDIAIIVIVFLLVILIAVFVYLL